MGKLKEHFYETAIAAAEDIKKLIKEKGDTVIDTVTLSQVYQGMRGIVGLVTETSLLDANEGATERHRTDTDDDDVVSNISTSRDSVQSLFPPLLNHLQAVGWNTQAVWVEEETKSCRLAIQSMTTSNGHHRNDAF